MKIIIFIGFLFSLISPFAQCELTVTTNEPYCFEYSDGSIILNVTGLADDVIFEIKNEMGELENEDNSNTANMLTGGWYYFNITDDGGCDIEDSVFLEQPAELDIDLTLMPSSGHSEPDCDGYAVVDTVYNYYMEDGEGYSDISYIWTPNPAGIGGPSADSSYNYCPGPCFLTINDDGGCSKSFDFTIEGLVSVEKLATPEFTVTPVNKQEVQIILSLYESPLVST